MDLGFDPAEMDALVQGNHGNPFSVLGPHRVDRDHWLIRVFWPGARTVDLFNSQSLALWSSMTRLHEVGLFAALVEITDRPAQVSMGQPQYLIEVDGGQKIRDPYSFPIMLGTLDQHLIKEGNHWQSYDRLGAHFISVDGVYGCYFAVWAPNAKRVSVVGDFNGWDGRHHVLRLCHDCGVWELFIPGVQPGALYKFEILDQSGQQRMLKSDPMARSMETDFGTASVVVDPTPYVWADEEWMANRIQTGAIDAPMSIYEVHLGSWKRRLDEDGRVLTYRELAIDLVPYVQGMGFTHIELLPVSEHPFDGSWGYQPVGLFAPTHRFGGPDDFRYFVECCHQAGIGVIVDWVPAHFPEDQHGLRTFDGTFLYEHEDPRQGWHPDWETCIYNLGRAEVVNFLITNALFWIESFHVDGLRVDAVSSMLYLDYSRKPGEWVPNCYGGNENLESVAFLQKLNHQVSEQAPGVVVIAEESTAWPRVSAPAVLGGLGFDYKWNMGWMHDTLNYLSKQSIHRRYHHDSLTFSQLYAYSERFVLPLSHDEVVHGKGSLWTRMAGDAWQKAANLRLLFAYQYTHPGKKLLFMGGEFGQIREWNHDIGLDWQLVDDDKSLHARVRDLVRDLNLLYRALPALHVLDTKPEGFQWIDCHDEDQSVIAFIRQGQEPKSCAVVVFNFTPVVRHDYRIGVPFSGLWRERINTDAAYYGGSNIGNQGGMQADDHTWHGRPYSLSLTLPPLGALILLPATESSDLS
ncbi:MAG: 1,4-alpha-glucan branching protein GlgB [Magnetococcales bacterium]|nr:1,4-alpha-glucan branching protein GlgB [Magnetococcales bacterium]